MEKYIDNSGNEFQADKLLDCPFCGSEPKMTFIGNNHTKSRKVKIKCKNAFCRIETTTGSIRNDAEWTAKTSIEVWNRRI